jgi:hypothetical protein
MKNNTIMKKTLIFMLIFALSTSCLIGENPGDTSKVKKRFISLKAFYQGGSVLQTNDFLQGDNSTGEPVNRFHALSVQVNWDTDGSKLWQQLYGYPSYGVGAYWVKFPQTEELGNPTALYLFISGPFKRWSKWTFNYDIGFGLTYNWKPYNVETNPFNIAVGSYNTVYIDAGLSINWLMAKQWELSLGFSFTHFSNGATAVPNFGVNLVAPRLGLKYKFYHGIPEYKTQEVPKYQDEWEWYGSFAYGSKQIEVDTANTGLKDKYLNENFNVFVISTAMLRQVTYKSKFGIGLDINYDGSTNAEIDVSDGVPNAVSVPFIEKCSIGIYGSYELVLNKISLAIHPGYYILRKEYDGQSPAFYQRVGLKWNFWEGMFAGIFVRASNFSKAEFIEWTLGYRLRW